MNQEPVVIKFNVPESPISPEPKGPIGRVINWFKSLSGPKATKVITIGSIIFISLTFISIIGFTLLANNKAFKSKHSLSQSGSIPAESNGSVKASAALPGGGVSTGIGGTTGTNSPVVTLTASPGSVKIGGVSQLTWTVTNNPSSCTASDDWSGSKPASGSANTQALSEQKTYLFTLTCKTATGTGFSTVSVGTITQTGGTGSVTLRPQLNFAAVPTSVYVGDSSTLTWTTTNNPSSCTASGDWSGSKPATGPASTGTLNTAKQYSFTLQCSNSAGQSPSVSVSVAVINPPPGLPIVTLSDNPVGPILPGGSTTLSWTTTNNPSSCTASGNWSGNKPATGSFNTGALNTIQSYTYNITCGNGTGTTFDSAVIAVLPNPPAISLTVSPTSIYVGNSATISWAVSNNTSGTTCKASGDWPGSLTITPTSGGSRSTGTINTAKTYTYSLSCTNEGGTSYQNNVPLTVTVPSPPIVSISVNPISITAGQSATINWSATNNPTSCTGSNSLANPVTPLSGGSRSTGALAAGTYTYTLQCSNAGGSSNVAQTSLSVSSGGGATAAPVVTISVSPTSISTNSAATVSWSATNSPTSCSAGGTTSNWVTSPGASGSTSTGVITTAGTRTYSITCTNSKGSGTGTTSPVLTVVSLPTVSVSLASTSINTGSSTTYSWSSTGASSCTGGGSLSGSLGTSGGPITTGAIATPGTYSYTVTCVNSIGGSASSTATLVVSNAATVYCSGLTPCYGPAEVAAHASPGNCWGWNLTWVVDITSFRPHHSGGVGAGSLESAASTCNHDIHSILSGSASVSGYKDSGGNTTHSHSSSVTNNSGSSQLLPYRVGYYDATAP